MLLKYWWTHVPDIMVGSPQFQHMHFPDSVRQVIESLQCCAMMVTYPSWTPAIVPLYLCPHSAIHATLLSYLV